MRTILAQIRLNSPKIAPKWPKIASTSFRKSGTIGGATLKLAISVEEPLVSSRVLLLTLYQYIM
jgi:xanthine dehydrogenase iron-sulfur cluster and FAD-binding subunit A